jgi:hypothetical protein
VTWLYLLWTGAHLGRGPFDNGQAQEVSLLNSVLTTAAELAKRIQPNAVFHQRNLFSQDEVAKVQTLQD